PTSPSVSSPSALRVPWKNNVGPTCPSMPLLGSVGVTCLNTAPLTFSRSLLTSVFTSRLYHVFSAMPASRLTLVSLVSCPVFGSMVASCSASELPWSYRIRASPLPPGAASSRATSPAPFVLLYVWMRTSACRNRLLQIRVDPPGVYLVSHVSPAGPAPPV